MKHAVFLALIAWASLAATGCSDSLLKRTPKELQRPKTGAYGNVAGTVRAQSPHYTLIGATGPSGGARNNATNQLHNGMRTAHP